MLPKLEPTQTINLEYQAYLEALQSSNFQGEIDHRYSARLAQSVDNSIYQYIPEAILYPKDDQDLVIALKLAQQSAYKGVNFSPRGGGTGTNGQSLNKGILVDLSRHFTQVESVDAKTTSAWVQTGVVKDFLNDELRPHGLFFGPDLSTSNRATIGGMVNTDASGAGSLVYGKTSDHVLEVEAVLIDGTKITTKTINSADLANHYSGKALAIAQQVKDWCEQQRQLINERFPNLNRFLTGYDLKNVFNDDLSQFDLGRILCGSEGTLAFITKVKLNVVPIPKSRVLVNIQYSDFEAALRHAPSLVAANATVVETIDSTVLDLARRDIIWHSVSELLDGETPYLGLNMVEFAGDVEDVSARLQHLLQVLGDDTESKIVGFKVCDELASIGKIYAMRKKAVGLLGAVKGPRKPLPFAEDTAVPPEQLADFIMEFRALLDDAKLNYGMFGHVDAGVLHVRPALDMCDPADERLLREISDKVAALTLKYGGLMWGEHGKGVRGEYATDVFGDELMHTLRSIKGLFDPDNRLNPGKLFTPVDSSVELYNIDDLKRGHRDRQIPVVVKDAYASSLNCNGNGLCFNYAKNSPMCPSFKATGDRVQSPKGRATIMREWLRLLSEQGIDVSRLENVKSASFIDKLKNTMAKDDDFNHQVKQAMSGCLACKACVNQCPINVDIPDLKSRFNYLYHKRYLRPVKDYLVANIEDSVPLMAKFPRLVNFASSNVLSRWLLKHTVGYVDAPELSIPTLNQRLQGDEALGYDLEALKALSPQQKQKTVLIVQDPFNSFYDAEVMHDLVQLLQKLGYLAVLLPFKPNGKPMHIKGFLDKFAKTAQDSSDFLNQLHQLGLPMVGIDPALVLTYREEYKQVLGEQRGDFHVDTLPEWLATQLAGIQVKDLEGEFTLLSHCTEQTALPQNMKSWQKIFAHFGLQLNTKPMGCCGMAGSYGHETENLVNSEALYNMGWRQQVQQNQSKLLVAGYSCRSQIKRMDGIHTLHPVQALVRALGA
ncbi:FAD-binding and (Fe-S)-binding domain-containing protein [Paraferrimonas sp. SM1919]|uniref:D-2-hydroxyglutarate dehydrogenase YdiJ n=1 Tax=Paraferrimonas sp. SM1919 TaxID=2662263 RepID=UPI0013CF7604|nr:FAD-binding and (Fe-S)-binding domain-containing protein [Paraferrimonas sp. SM1919]